MKYLKLFVLASILFTAKEALSHQQPPYKELCETLLISADCYERNFIYKKALLFRCEVLQSSADCYERLLPHPENPWPLQSNSIKCLSELQRHLEALRVKYKVAPRYEMSNLIYNCDLSSGEDPDICAADQLTNDMHVIGCL